MTNKMLLGNDRQNDYNDPHNKQLNYYKMTISN